jgi:hypothetical protein
MLYQENIFMLIFKDACVREKMCNEMCQFLFCVLSDQNTAKFKQTYYHSFQKV